MAGSDVRIEPADIGHGYDLAEHLRAEDSAEVVAAEGRAPLLAIIDAIESSSECWAVFIGGELVCVWGVVDRGFGTLTGHVGEAWVLTTDAVERHAKTFWRLCLELAPALLERWDAVYNAIDARHTKAVRWARRLGLPLQPAEPFGAARLPFHHFRATRGVLHV